MFGVFKDKRHLIEFCSAIALIIAMLLFITFRYEKDSQQATFFLRMLAGGTIGYGLARAAFGFAGSVNRAYNTGSTKLMKSLALLFFLGTIITSFAVLGGKLPASLSHNAINYGLIVGATMFGFGMAFTVCCASGVLTDLAESPLKALCVLFFFCAGAFIGKGIKGQEWMKWYTKPVFGIDGFSDGVNFTDMVSSAENPNFFGSIIVGLIFTVILCSVLYAVAEFYERRRKALNTYIGCGSEIAEENERNNHVKDENKWKELFYTVFVKPWSLTKGAVVIALGYAILMFCLGSSWGVSGPLGEWFARLLDLFGMDPAAIKEFSGVDTTKPFFEQAMYIQDISIFLGALIAFLFAGNFTRNVKSWLFNPLEIVLYAVGGIFLGIAINIAGGCNAGGLFSPIAQFSLSGWIYLVCIIIGGFAGNWVRKKYFKVCKIK